MSVKKYHVQLSTKQRKQLKRLSGRGKVSARKLNRARILLLADENRPKGPKTDAEIHDLLDVSPSTIVRVRQQFVTVGLDGALSEKPRCGRPVKFSGTQRAAITALACSSPPDGYDKWSLRLIADKVVELDFVESISYKTIGNLLKKNELSPHLKKQWCIGKLTPRFLWRMEDILWLYEQPYDPLHPVICYDERPCQLIDDVIMPLPIETRHPKREDYHYKRNGACNVLIAFEPATGQRFVSVRRQRTGKDYAQFMQEIAAIHYPQAEKVVLVQDNLNTHCPASFYAAFSALCVCLVGAI